VEVVQVQEILMATDVGAVEQEALESFHLILLLDLLDTLSLLEQEVQLATFNL
jgi:hypothetical protein